MTESDHQNGPRVSPTDYRAYVEKLDGIKIENERLLARNTLIISGGALTFSATLLKDLYPDPLFWTKGFLVASWILFALCAFLQFYADHLSGLSMETQRKNYDACYPHRLDEFESLPNRYNTWVRLINAVTPWILCLGFLSMIVFISYNFLHTKGAPMKEPTAGQTTQDAPPKPKPEKPVKRGVTTPVPPQPLPPDSKPTDPQLRNSQQ